MSGPPKVRSMNISVETEVRAVLGPAGNKARSPVVRKPLQKDEKRELRSVATEKPPASEAVAPQAVSKSVASSLCKKQTQPATLSSSLSRAGNVLKGHEVLLHSNLSLNASCSSDASTESSCSRASTGRLVSRRSTGVVNRRKPLSNGPRPAKVVPDGVDGSTLPPPLPSMRSKKTCAWITANTDPCYVTFHDEEWGMPVHDDKKLFELLSLSGALAELTWPAILGKRPIFREVFADFDPSVVAKLNEKKVIAPGSTASSLLSELKLRSIIENARQILKIVEEFGSFDNYCWSFVNHKPIVNGFRYPRQVPVKTPKAEVISKDMVRRGFRSVGPTVIYTFMQVSGITNDHLVGCYRFSECLAVMEETPDVSKTEGKDADRKLDIGRLGLAKAVEDLSVSSLSIKTDSSDEVGAMLA
ncbi:uncharacterized protein LOC116253451 [Nymphaea colorata]|nr:uncharacterized protein LOC116253451 [Nymphaea colorata]